MQNNANKSQKLIGTFLRRVGVFSRDKDGVTAIEFGLLALPFFALIAAILETSLVFMASNIFETAMHDTARLIRTGQVASEDYDIDDFRSSMCTRTFGLFNCDDIVINVRTAATFSDVAISEPLDPDTGDLILPDAFSPGIRNSIVVAEAYYKWESLFDIMGFNLATMSDGTLLMGTAQVFRNEPF